jgi:prepilin peptidase CpaA
MDINIIKFIFFSLPIIIALSAMTDVYNYIIPNKFNLFLIFSFYVFALLNPEFSYNDILSHSLAACLVLSIVFLLFSFGIIGGGDAKLIAASSLWFGFNDLGKYVIFIVLFGGIISLFFLAWRKTKPLAFYDKFIPLKRMFYGPECQQNKVLKKRSIPYATAIMIGFFVTLPNSQIFIQTFS